MISSYSLIILISIFVIALITETLWPLRESTQSKSVRIRRNLAVAAVSLILMRLIFLPFEIHAAQYVSDHQIGLLNLIELNPLLKTCLAIIFLDYTLYFWHMMNHRFGFLWRFHNAHHTDLDLDVSTASRFHFGELAFSTFFRIAQIFLFGIDVATLLLFETCVTAFAMFHHSNVRLPKILEIIFSKIIVAPRMHGIHHSVIKNETDSNYGTIFTIWDRIHRTLRLDVPQDSITIGNPSYSQFEEQSLIGILMMPFRKQKPWPKNLVKRNPTQYNNKK